MRSFIDFTQNAKSNKFEWLLIPLIKILSHRRFKILSVIRFLQNIHLKWHLNLNLHTFTGFRV